MTSMTNNVRTEERTDLGIQLAFGSTSRPVAEFRHRVRGLVEDHVSPLVSTCERDRRFPREAVAALGAAGLFHERWSGGIHGDLGRSVILSEEMGRAGLGGIGIGVGLHLEAATSLLRGFGTSAYAEEVLGRALDGESVCCVATSEQHVGSDLSAVETRLTREGDHWRVRGDKWFVSPGAAADHALVLCRGSGGPAIVLVPRTGLTPVERWATTGMRSLETVRLRVDARVTDDAVLVEPGSGLAAVGQGLMYERLALAAQVLGALDLASVLALTHLKRRKQFGTPLYRHQALRLRVADLRSRILVARRGLYATVAEISAGGRASASDAAALKVTVAQLGEKVTSECAHIFGGRGYVEGQTPLERLWRDFKVGRLGGGSDEMMWELVAAGFRPDHALYEKWIAT
ncbi:acyl-CoA dehydrogenase family protein [Streptomyces pratensis]|jgi:alkylation response protein AidB-like acyl-CoA dehydrogenase|uniref:acyl-CoA dehydrogenase family protein n=1 Tax=Streptomyces pratensis TaxID=1169025 RepID=UPI003636D833